MRDTLGPGTILGYCTNVHAGRSLAEVKKNLEQYALAVKQRVSPDQPMGVGLWFSAAVINEIAEMAQSEDAILELRSWLEERGLAPYTVNGFPYADFHQPVVKHAVYQPDWSDPRRLYYTINLMNLLHGLLPEGAVGSISTLPIGWNDHVGAGWSDHLLDMIEALADLEQQTGRLIHLDLEPEPGCEIGDTQTCFALLTVLNLMSGLPKDMIRRYVRICHDVCHSAVMFEAPTKMLTWCRDSGFKIGKVQLSSAIRAVFAGKPTAVKSKMRSQLASFAEPRYLHQTTIGSKDGHALKAFHDDLQGALGERKSSGYEWRVHYHVPIYLDAIGMLDTSQQAIIEFLHAVRPEDDIRHFEVETYAWDVLPDDLKVPDLADGIARELLWVKEQAAKIT